MTENVALGIKQVNFGRRINNHRVAGKLCQAIEVGDAVTDKVPLPRYVHCDGRVESLREFFVIQLCIDAPGDEKDGPHDDHDNEQCG